MSAINCCLLGYLKVAGYNCTKMLLGRIIFMGVLLHALRHWLPLYAFEFEERACFTLRDVACLLRLASEIRFILPVLSFSWCTTWDLSPYSCLQESSLDINNSKDLSSRVLVRLIVFPHLLTWRVFRSITATWHPNSRWRSVIASAALLWLIGYYWFWPVIEDNVFSLLRPW